MCARCYFYYHCPYNYCYHIIIFKIIINCWASRAARLPIGVRGAESDRRAAAAAAALTPLGGGDDGPAAAAARMLAPSPVEKPLTRTARVTAAAAAARFLAPRFSRVRLERRRERLEDLRIGSCEAFIAARAARRIGLVVLALLFWLGCFGFVVLTLVFCTSVLSSSLSLPGQLQGRGEHGSGGPSEGGGSYKLPGQLHIIWRAPARTRRRGERRGPFGLGEGRRVTRM